MPSDFPFQGENQWYTGFAEAMITEIELNAEEIEFLKKQTNKKSPSSALRAATDEYIRYRKRMNLVESEEAIEFDSSLLKEMEDKETNGDN